MLGLYIMGLEKTAETYLFASLTSVCLAVGYGFIGATWLVHKTSDGLQAKALRWARLSLWGVIAGVGAVSLATPLVSDRIFGKWFAFPEILWLVPLPLVSGALIAALWLMLRRMPFAGDRWDWLPFATSSAIFALAFSASPTASTPTWCRSG